ncbi:hypothetical protein K1719_020945 [Acacia pycnantha]|nr:hypothetical protein K1719_020945 [Acacia pycnantha]
MDDRMPDKETEQETEQSGESSNRSDCKVPAESEEMTKLMELYPVAPCTEEEYNEWRENCPFMCSSSDSHEETNPLVQAPQHYPNRIQVVNPATTTAEDSFGPWMLVSRRGNRTRLPQRSDFKEQRQSSKNGTKVTKSSFVGQSSRFAAIEDLQDDQHLTAAETAVNQGEAGQTEAHLPTNSVSQNSNKRERVSLRKPSGQSKRKEAAGLSQSQKTELGPNNKTFYKLKSGGPILSTNEAGPANALTDLDHVDPKKMVTIASEEKSNTSNEMVPHMGSRKVQDKQSKGHRIHTIVQGNLNIKSHQSSPALTVNSNASKIDHLSGDSSKAPHQDAAQLHDLRPPEHWDPNDDVAPEFLEANGTYVAETQLENQQDEGSGGPRSGLRNIAVTVVFSVGLFIIFRFTVASTGISGRRRGLIRKLDKFGRKRENSESVDFQIPYSCCNLRKIWPLGFVLYDHGFV